MTDFPTSTHGITPDVTVSWLTRATADTLGNYADAIVTALLEGPEPGDDPEVAELTMTWFRRGLANVVTEIHGRALRNTEGHSR